MIRLTAVAVAAFMLGSFTGYNERDRLAEIERVEAMDKAVADFIKKQDHARTVEKAYAETEGKTRIVYKTIIKKVKDYVPVKQTTDSDCNLSHGTVRLLDSAAKNAVPLTAAAPDETDFAASAINESRLIEFAHESIGRYNEARDQCNALIGWIETTRGPGTD